MYVPASQLAGSGVLLPSGQSKPSGQSSHVTAPELLAWVPATQLAHSPDRSVAAWLPAAQSSGAVEPATQKLPAGQAVHSSVSVRLVDAEYEPATHGRAAAARAGQ